MAKAVVMPKAGISVESCIIGQWRKKVGEKVTEGEILFDYETDKASFECESTATGTLLAIFYENGDEVPCLVNVCAVGEAGEDVSAFKPAGAVGAVETKKPAEAAAVKAEIPSPAAQNTVAASAVSPRAKKLANQLKVDPLDAVPTGPNGRIIARDVESAARQGAGTGIGGRFGEKLSAKSSAAKPEAAFVDEKFTQIRKAISKAMTRSLSEMAQLTNHHSFDATQIMSFRAQCKNAGAVFGMEKVSLNDILLFAVARTLKTHAALNAHLIDGDVLRKFNSVHLGVAVDTPRGLMVPTVFDADRKSLTEISAEVKSLGAAAQAGNINPDLLQGGTFTVSNLGSLGVEMFTPIINPPQVAILGVCGISTRVRESSKGIETYPSMGLSLTYDHRAVDGAPASRFVQDLCKNLENFSVLLAAE